MGKNVSRRISTKDRYITVQEDRLTYMCVTTHERKTTQILTVNCRISKSLASTTCRYVLTTLQKLSNGLTTCLFHRRSSRETTISTSLCTRQCNMSPPSHERDIHATICVSRHQIVVTETSMLPEVLFVAALISLVCCSFDCNTINLRSTLR